MARSITTICEAGEYLRGLYKNAGDHAGDMFEVYPKVYAAAMAHIDTNSLQVYQRIGKTANMAWANFNGHRYALTYDHKGGIVVREKTTHGKSLKRFDRNSTFEEIYRFFENLSSSGKKKKI